MKNTNFNYDSVILGEGCVYSTDCELTQLNNNVMVCGGSGSGKTMSISEPRMLMTHTGTLITTLTKRRLFYKYAPMFKERGYAVEDLNFIEPDKSTIAYDPVQYIKKTADITFLAEAIVMSNPQKENSGGDPYWNEAAISLHSAEIAYVLETEEEPSYNKVLELHAEISDPDSGDNISRYVRRKFEHLHELNPDSFAYSCWKSFDRLPEKTSGCVYGTLHTVLDKIFTPELREMMDQAKQIDFEKLANEKTVLFISTSAVNRSMNAFVNLFYSQIFKELFEYAETLPEGELPLPVHVLCDDFATGSRIPTFAEYISIFREKKISVTILLQSESQLESIYGYHDATTIVNNCDSFVYLGGQDVKTARNISEKANMLLEDVLYLPIGEEILIRRGQKPIVTRRYQTLEDETWQEVDRAYKESLVESRNKPEAKASSSRFEGKQLQVDLLEEDPLADLEEELRRLFD